MYANDGASDYKYCESVSFCQEQNVIEFWISLFTIIFYRKALILLFF